MEVSKCEELTILKFEDRDSTEPVMFGSSICMQTAEGYYLAFKGNGEMKVEKNQRYEEGTNGIAKLTKWTILDARKIASRERVTPFNDVCFKSPFGHYFQVEQGEDLISANGPEITEAAIFKISKAQIPHLPDWLFKRPHLNHNQITSQYQGFLELGSQARQKDDRPKNLGSFPLDIQETFLIEDLLYAMTSIEGVYIRRKAVARNASSSLLYNGQPGQTIEFQIEPYLPQPTCDFSLQFLVNKMLPLCNNHDFIQEFVNVHSQFEYGLVSQALCGAIRVLLKEYLLLVTQLDTEFMKADLSLQKVWFYVQNSIRIMDNLKRLVLDAGSKKGGALLNAIYRLMINSSDAAIRDLFAFLLEKASTPYFMILKRWIFSGVLEDPFSEFFVKENTSCKKENIEVDLNDKYWQERFTFREDMVPVFLEKYQHKVLHAGKYLHVIRECGPAYTAKLKNPFEDLDTGSGGFIFSKVEPNQVGDVEMADDTVIDTKPKTSASYNFYAPIEQAFEHNSALLLTTVMNDFQLLKRLESMNHYFFFDRGDFFSHFVDGCEEILEKYTSEVKMEKLESYLEMAIRTSSANSDPFKDDVTCELNGYGVSEQLFVTWVTRGALGSKAFGHDNAASATQTNSNVLNIGQTSRTMKVYEAFTIDYKMKWPLTLIVSKKAINKYQLLFRHLLQCKYVEKYLENVWLQHQATKECDVQKELQQTYALRHRMLQFCKNYMYYMQIEVLEPNFHKFKLQLKEAKNVDQIIELHSNFLDVCLKECLLTDQNLFRIITQINLRTHYFSRVIIRFFLNVQAEETLDRVRDGDEDMNTEEKKEELLLHPCEKRRRQKQKEADCIKKNIVENNYPTMVDKFEKTFDGYMKDLLQHLTSSSRYETHIANLAQRLDYNGYYTRSYLDGGRGGVGTDIIDLK